MFEPPPHTLLRIGTQCAFADAPDWVERALRRAPWVVVRRSLPRGGRIPVGVRGGSRGQRFAAWLARDEILEQVQPPQLVPVAPGRRALAAIQALDAAGRILAGHGLQGDWGPAGSVGFELASGCESATADSDLDLILTLRQLPPVAQARRLCQALGCLPVRADVLLELPQGAVALAEFSRSPGSFVLRTATGPRLVTADSPH